jgi:hypothetical protein
MIFVAALVAVAAAVAAGAAFAAHRWVPLSADTEAQVREAIVGFELAKASTRPNNMIGKKLTPEDKAVLQARFLRGIQRFASGPELQQWQSWDYARALLEDERGGGEFAGRSGKIVYWDFLRRGLDGCVVVRAGVGERYRIVRWDVEAGRAVPYRSWEPSVSVDDYTLQKSGGVWKVFTTRHWMFYDPATGQLGTGP